MQYEKWEVLTRGQKRLRKAVIAVPVVLVLVAGVGASILTRIGLEKVPTALIFVDVAVALLGVIATFILLCIKAYWLREHRRWMYGLLEVAFAVVVVVVTSYNWIGSAPGAPPGWSFPLVSTCAQYAAGLYVMVRGLDNIGQGVKDDPVWGRRWRWFALHQVDPPK
ncbi:hypothetical protein NKH16_01330 [Mesorhizobium sp. M1307]|uniref:hypothetical protein n=1 Tax=Mesorhizobium sp. M1307 TaxID=2957079 RepID=UPI003334F091